jgi:DNA polymerase
MRDRRGTRWPMDAEHSTFPALQVLQDDIARCRVCAEFAPAFSKPAAMNRGSPGPIMIVGQGPGKTELRAERAFAGPTGRRLDQWLTEAGCDPNDPRRHIYCTSITKCYTSDDNQIPRMARHCAKFLQQQLAITRPQLVVTLGTLAYEHFAVDATPADEAWCRLFDSRVQFPLLADDEQFHILVWPHPSPLNRWLNSPDNLAKLRGTFPIIKRVIEGVQ